LAKELNDKPRPTTAASRANFFTESLTNQINLKLGQKFLDKSITANGVRTKYRAYAKSCFQQI
jgi:hypothetical protein